ncbi:hypothetical protein CCHR01_05085 [Colletotrichum chrysophilum]|uniref:Uncharacterized protein n=1 Tax=Colletotrichum chrysophilum TaxID=1836956 RepID=A0AAD9EPU5_9PEZI|nr:hypothetical protein CCHR01_05085 [Colletotrichum chrysophilum]
MSPRDPILVPRTNPVECEVIPIASMSSGGSYESPPSYRWTMGQPTDKLLPSSQPPRYAPDNTRSESVSGSSTSNGAIADSDTVKMPPALRTWGPISPWPEFRIFSPDKKHSYAAYRAGTFSGKRGTITIRDGATDGHDTLVTVGKSPGMSFMRSIIVTVEARPELHQEQFTTTMSSGSMFVSSRQRWIFEIPIVTNGELTWERFRWNFTGGKTIKDTVGCTWGYQLVWLPRPTTLPGIRTGDGAPLKPQGAGPQRPAQATGRGEIVAVISMCLACCSAEPYRFKFFGTGLRGTLGEKFEVVAVATGFWLCTR